MRQERGVIFGSILRWLLTEKEKKKKRRYISIYRQGGKEWAGAALYPLPAFTTQPWADSHTL